MERVSSTDSLTVMGIGSSGCVEHLTALFVYGSLCKGSRNHELLSDARYVGEAMTKDDFVLLEHKETSLVGIAEQDAVPKQTAESTVRPVKREASSVKGEVYLVPYSDVCALDKFEGTVFQLYERTSLRVRLSHVEAGTESLLDEWLDEQANDDSDSDDNAGESNLSGSPGLSGGAYVPPWVRPTFVSARQPEPVKARTILAYAYMFHPSVLESSTSTKHREAAA